MSKTFKVGDRVRLTGYFWHNALKGTEQVIVELSELGTCGKFYDQKGEHWYTWLSPTDPWAAELIVSEEGVKNMARLPRTRKGKTPIDVGIVEQDGLTRVRLSMGEDGQPGRKNSDLDIQETEDLVTLLSYNLAVAKGEITIT